MGRCGNNLFNRYRSYWIHPVECTDMSAEFARLMVAELNTRISLMDDTELDVIIALEQYRDSILSVMARMGHTVGDTVSGD